MWAGHRSSAERSRRNVRLFGTRQFAQLLRRYPTGDRATHKTNRNAIFAFTNQGSGAFVIVLINFVKHIGGIRAEVWIFTFAAHYKSLRLSQVSFPTSRRTRNGDRGRCLFKIHSLTTTFTNRSATSAMSSSSPTTVKTAATVPSPIGRLSEYLRFPPLTTYAKLPFLPATEYLIA